MRDGQLIVALVIPLGIIAAITLLEWRHWLPARGKFKCTFVFLAGAAVIFFLFTTGIPPAWFSGGKEAFALALSLLAGGFVAPREEGRTYGLPLFLGMGMTLLALNVLPHV
jgi:hypothetical protein